MSSARLKQGQRVQSWELTPCCRILGKLPNTLCFVFLTCEMRNKKIPYFVDLLMGYILMYKALMEYHT